jgi:hypothetical protein
MHSASFSSTTFHKFQGISNLFSDVFTFQHHATLYSKCNTSLVCSKLYESNLPVKRVFFLLNATFAVEIMHLVPFVHLLSCYQANEIIEFGYIYGVQHLPECYVFEVLKRNLI